MYLFVYYVNIIGNRLINSMTSFVLQSHQLLMNFEEPLKDYVRAVQSIKVYYAFNSFNAQTLHLPIYRPEF